MDVKKFAIQIILLLLVSFGAMYLAFNSSLLGGMMSIGNPNTSSETTIKVGEAVVKVEVADSKEERSKGLGGRPSLASDSGMIFIFPESKKQQFWMKGMRFPIDIIFIDQGRVVDILKNIPAPASNQNDQTLPIYEPVAPANMVLEVNSGFVESYGIKVGDSVFLLKE